jgi:hypothetical protein
MRNIIKAYFNEILIIIISFFLFFIGILYSDDPGFYSREFMSSGGDDFDLFIGTTWLNLYGIIFGMINLIVNIILLKYKNKIINISYIIYMTIFVIQLFVLFLVNLDTSLLYVFFTFDLFSIWIIIYIFGTLIIVCSMNLIKHSVISFEYIELKIIYNILIIIGFILFLAIIWSIIWLFNNYLIQIIKTIIIQ